LLNNNKEGLTSGRRWLALQSHKLRDHVCLPVLQSLMYFDSHRALLIATYTSGQ